MEDLPAMVETAGEMFGASAECLRKTLPRYDTGWWTLYSLYPHALADVAKPIYHRVHMDQLVVLHRLTGHEDLRERAQRWASYDRPRHRALALVQKAAFTVAEAPGRRRWRSAHRSE